MRILAIGSHPDDLDIGCGGTLAGVGFLPEEYTDITTTLETKLMALEKHESQLKWMKDHHGIDFLDFVRTVSRFRGL